MQCGLLLDTQDVVEILNGLAGGAFAKIVEARDDDQTLAGLVQGKADVAEIRVRDVLQFGQRAGDPDTDHGTASIELAIKRLDVRSGLRLRESDVDAGKNAA